MENKILIDTESEKILLNQMILDDDIVDEAVERTPLNSFYNRNYQDCYKVILSIRSRNEKVDMFTFITESKLKKIPFDVIEGVTNSVTSSANWTFYSENILKCYQARLMMNVLGQAREKINKDNADEIMMNVSNQIDSINSLSNTVVEKSQLEMMIEMTPMIENMLVDPKASYGYMTGLDAFDEITGGIHSEYILICARPSMGKTFLAQQISLSVAKEHKVAFIELEMSAKQINFRNIAILSHLRMNDIKYGLIKNDKMKIARVQQAIQNLADGIGKNYKVVEPATRKLSSIVAYIRKAVRKDGVELVFIDHVGLIQSDNSFSSSWESAREISNTLQKLQRELDIPIIGLSQRSRDSEGGKNKGDLSTIRGSGAYEEDADLIITIEHNRATDVEEQKKIGRDAENIDCELYVAKNRNGGCGVAKCVFKPSYGRFCDIAKGNYDA